MIDWYDSLKPRGAPLSDVEAALQWVYDHGEIQSSAEIAMGLGWSIERVVAAMEAAQAQGRAKRGRNGGAYEAEAILHYLKTPPGILHLPEGAHIKWPNGDIDRTTCDSLWVDPEAAARGMTEETGQESNPEEIRGFLEGEVGRLFRRVSAPFKNFNIIICEIAPRFYDDAPAGATDKITDKIAGGILDALKVVEPREVDSGEDAVSGTD